MLIVVERRETFHYYYPMGVHPPGDLTVTKILHFFLGCQANGRSVLIDRFAAVWAAVGQRLCLKAVMADSAEIVVHNTQVVKQKVYICIIL